MPSGDLKIRIPLGLLLIGLVVGLFWLDARLADWAWRKAPDGRLLLAAKYAFMSGPIVAALLAVFVVVGSIEYCQLARAAGHCPTAWIVVIFSLGLALAPWWAVLLDPGWGLTTGLVVLAFMAAATRQLLRGQIDTATSALASTLFGILYLGLLPSFLLKVRVADRLTGAWLLLGVIAVVKMSDVGAFFVGKFFGKKKLCPTISPGKTWAGLLGAVLGGLVTSIAFWAAGSTIHYGVSDPRWLGFGQAIVFGLLAPLVGQVGDLTESLLKRNAGRKDAGRLLPEFGGVLDMLDSPLLVGPLAYWVFVALPAAISGQT